MKQKYIIAIVALAVLILAGAGIGYYQSSAVTSGKGKAGSTSSPSSSSIQGESGIIAGTVMNTGGLPCNIGDSEFNSPGCEKPVPNFEVVIYKADQKTVAAKVVSGEKGEFKMTLAVGTYYYLSEKSRSGIGRSYSYPSQIEVRAGETSQISVKFDSGMR